MDVLNVVLTLVYISACLFLGFVVLIQKGEGGGLGGAFGGGAVDVAFGAKADTTWKKATGVVATIFMVLAIMLGVVDQQRHKSSIAVQAATQEARERRAQQQQPEGPGLERDDSEPGRLEVGPGPADAPGDD